MFRLTEFDLLDASECQKVSEKLRRMRRDYGDAREIPERLWQRLYFHDGEFTTCILRMGVSDVMAIGTTKRNPPDEPDDGRAQEIALCRAVENRYAGAEWIHDPESQPMNSAMWSEGFAKRRAPPLPKPGPAYREVAAMDHVNKVASEVEELRARLKLAKQQESGS